MWVERRGNPGPWGTGASPGLLFQFNLSVAIPMTTISSNALDQTGRISAARPLGTPKQTAELHQWGTGGWCRETGPGIGRRGAGGGVGRFTCRLSTRLVFTPVDFSDHSRASGSEKLQTGPTPLIHSIPSIPSFHSILPFHSVPSSGVNISVPSSTPFPPPTSSLGLTFGTP